MKNLLSEDKNHQEFENEDNEDNQSINEDVVENEEATSVDELIQQMEQANQEIDEELESIQEEYVQPQCERKQTKFMNLEDFNIKSYDEENIITQGVKPTVEYDENEGVVLANIMMSMAQTYSLKSGIRQFGKKGEDAAFEEMNQLHKQGCFDPKDASKYWTPSSA